MKKPGIYILIVGTVFVLLAAALTLLPRPRYSELERRDLTAFPQLTARSLADGSFTSGVSTWFSDTEPFRDVLLQGAMWIRDKAGIVLGEDQIRFHAGDAEMPEDPEPEAETTEESDSLQAYQREGGADEFAKIASAGIVIMGKGENVRALMGFFAGNKYGFSYAEAVNRYHRALGDSVRIYCMPIPTSTEYYLPEGVSKKIKKQWPVIENIFNSLEEGVKPVNIYNVLAKHVDEPIYLRTDHHWAPLGAYYAARKFAEVADVPFRDLSHYKADTVHRYVGTMYMYSKDMAVKKAPEDFIWYEPTDAQYTTSYIYYGLCKQYHITGESPWKEGKYFFPRKDGEASAYQVFMNADGVVCRVRTEVGNGRRLIILKDSFGNAVPGYLFYSFDEIHIIDCRYFTKNMVQYVKDNHITDILFANNTGACCADMFISNYKKFLTQKGYSYCHVDHDKEEAEKAAAEAAAAAKSAGSAPAPAAGEAAASAE